MLEIFQLMFMMVFFFKFNYLFMNLLFIMMFFMLFNLNWVDWSFLFMGMGVSLFSYGLMILMLWVFGLILMSLKKLGDYCSWLILLLMFVMYFSFSSMNLLTFYFYFEFSLLLIFFLIVIWGHGSNRVLAGYYILFYTMIFSLPFLFILVYLFDLLGSLSFYLMENIDFYMLDFLVVYLLMSFFVKIPMYLFHSWLLKAHVEAPYYGSMILAAVMLKLGGYGLLRVLMVFDSLLVKFKSMLLYVSLVGIIFVSLVCLRQIDMKILVAMSSIVHMGIMIMGMLTLTNLGVLGGYLMMISHGLCSSGLFFLINVVYEVTNSRLFLLNKGLMVSLPSLSLMWFFLCSSNMSAPMSLNLVSEVFLLISVIGWMKILLVVLLIYCILSFLFSLILFANLIHGKNSFFVSVNGQLKIYFILLLHWVPLNIIVLNLSIIV